MSRHLMARFRRVHAAGVDWQVGPSGWQNWAKPGPAGQHTLPDEHQSAIVYHGEQKHALEVMPVRPNSKRPVKPVKDGHNEWVWSIFKHDPNDTANLDRPWRFPRDWARDVEDSGSPAEYHGLADNPEDAKRDAQSNWELHKQFMDSRNPLNQPDLNLDRFGDPEEGYDIFGERP